MAKESENIFLSYAKEDGGKAADLYESLTATGLSVWFDKKSLKPGERWKSAISNAIRTSRYFVALMSSGSSHKKGYVQQEIREALEVLNEFPDNEIYLIPVRLDDCAPSHLRLNDLNWVDMFPSWQEGIQKLLNFFSPQNAEVNSSDASSKIKLIPSSSVRSDGLYISDVLISKKVNYRKFFRFYSDGTVLHVSSTGKPSEIIKWFSKEGNQRSGYSFGQGRFKIEGDQINFSTTSKTGTVDFEGSVFEKSLILKFHSHINGNRGMEEYIFTEVPSGKLL
jgi:hypothetical protein